MKSTYYKAAKALLFMDLIFKEEENANEWNEI